MKQETIKDLLSLITGDKASLNQIVNDNGNAYSILISTDKNKLSILIEKKKLSDKKEFEKWLKDMKIDDEVFTNAYLELARKLNVTADELQDMYNTTTDLDSIIKLFKQEIKLSSINKINDMIKRLDLVVSK